MKEDVNNPMNINVECNNASIFYHNVQDSEDSSDE